MEIPHWKRKTPFQKEWEALCKREKAFLERRKLKKESVLNQLLTEKVPEKLQHTLDIAFEKAFLLIFEKGTGIIEKTYSKEALKNKYKVNLYADELYHNRSHYAFFQKMQIRQESKIRFSPVQQVLVWAFLELGSPTFLFLPE